MQSFPYSNAKANRNYHQIGTWLTLTVSSLFLSACLTETNDTTDPTNDPTPSHEITFTGFPSSVSQTPSQSAAISGTIASAAGLDSLIIKSYTNKDISVSNSKSTLNGATSYSIPDWKYSVTSATCNGTHHVDFLAYSGSTSKTKRVDIVVTGASSCQVVVPPDSTGNLATVTNIAMGAQKNPSLGSSIDLDGPQVMLSAMANQNPGKIDLVYLNSFATDSDKLGSPAWAKDNATFVSGWSVFNETLFYKLASTVVFANVKTATELEALWDASKATATNIDVVKGDLIIAKTNLGKLVLIEITNQVVGETGTITIKLAK